MRFQGVCWDLEIFKKRKKKRKEREPAPLRIPYSSDLISG